mmetsp:Transcript_41093/g.41978  ORF Transcript_41093/g.41978 Transcript_41093/m.41978 type:complete len:326 (+) Transcript_41093:67-1044(+)
MFSFKKLIFQKNSVVMTSCQILYLMCSVRFVRSFSSSTQKPVSGIFWNGISSRDIAEKLSITLQLPLSDSPFKGLQLSWNEKNQLQLICFDKSIDIGSKPFAIDFLDIKARKRYQSASSELLCRAMGKKELNPTHNLIGVSNSVTSLSTNQNHSNLIWDLTAGLGRDAMLLVSSGWTVHMFERNPILYELLSDAVIRFKTATPERADSIHLSYTNELSKSLLADISSLTSSLNPPYGVYIDPMYSPKFVGKKSKVKKDTQVLHHILGVDEGLDEENNISLFNVAKAVARNRVVIKRPLSSPPLAGAVPHHSLKGSSQRFDVYFRK